MSRRDEIIQQLLVEPTDSDQYLSSEEMLGRAIDAAIEEVRRWSLVNGFAPIMQGELMISLNELGTFFDSLKGEK